MTVESNNGLPPLGRVVVWLNDPDNWVGQSGLLTRIEQHAVYAVVIIGLAAVVGIPTGLLLGHSGRGIRSVTIIANSLRAIPVLGLLVFLIVTLSPQISDQAPLGAFLPAGSVPYAIPAGLVLLILAIPAIVAGTYGGVQAVDEAARDAARALGLNGLQTVRQLELPCAAPLIVSGVRSATLQVIATLTVAAYAPLIGGLGRFIVDGDQDLADPRYGYPAMVSAGLVIAVMAIAADLGLSAVQRAVAPRGTRPARSRADRRSVSSPDVLHPTSQLP